MQNKKRLLTVFIPLITFLLLSAVSLGFTPSPALAETSYPLSTLTGPNDFNFLLQAQAIKFEGGKWTYNFTWKRTRIATGTVVIAPSVNESFRVAELDPAPQTKDATNPLVMRLDPATRYVFRYYSVPGCNQSAVENDTECVAIRSIYFNTRDQNGKIMATSEVPLSQGGTKVEIATGGGNITAGIVPSSLTGLSFDQLATIVSQLTTLVQQLIAQLAGKVALPNSEPNVTITTQNGTMVTDHALSPACPDGNPNTWAAQTTPASSWCYKGMTMYVQLLNLPTGLAVTTANGLGIEPQDGVENPLFQYTTDSQSHSSYLSRFIGTPLGSSQVQLSAASHIGDLQADNSPYKNHDYKEIWLYATAGRKFYANIYYPASSCADASVIVNKNLNLPPGLAMGNCHNEPLTGFVTADGKPSHINISLLSGTIPQGAAAGVYLLEYNTSQPTNSSLGTKTRIYIIVQGSKKFVDTKMTDPATSGKPISNATLGSRAGIYWNQSNSFNMGTIWDDLDLWIAPGDQSGSFPEDATGKMFIGTFKSGDANGIHQICNSSTSGGSDPLQYGCGLYNWLVGSTQGQNIAQSGTYTIFVTPHIPYADSSGKAFAYLYGNCGGLRADSAYPGHQLPNISGCTGYTWGATTLTIDPAANGTVLPTQTAGVPVASFSQLDIWAKATVNGTVISEQSIGPHGTSNGQITSCSGGNDAGGVICVGPVASVMNVKPGDRMHYEWKIRLYDPTGTTGKTPDAQGYVPAGNSISSVIFVAGNTNFNFNKASDMQRLRYCTSGIVSGGFDYGESQGYINNAIGSADISIPSECTDVMGKGINVVQQVRVNVTLNGGGSTWGGYNMGGVDIGPLSSGIGIVDCNLNNTCVSQITNPNSLPNGFTGADPAVCYVPTADQLSSQLGLQCESVNAENTFSANSTGYGFGFSIPSSWKFDQFTFAEDASQSKVESGCIGGCNILNWYNNTTDRTKSPIKITGLANSHNYWNRITFYCNSATTKYVATSFSCSLDQNGNVHQ